MKAEKPSDLAIVALAIAVATAVAVCYLAFITGQDSDRQKKNDDAIVACVQSHEIYTWKLFNQCYDDYKNR